MSKKKENKKKAKNGSNNSDDDEEGSGEGTSILIAIQVNLKNLAEIPVPKGKKGKGDFFNFFDF